MEKIYPTNKKKENAYHLPEYSQVVPTCHMRNNYYTGEKNVPKHFKKTGITSH